MEFKEIQELIKLVNKTNVSEFKLEEGDFKILIRSKAFAESKFTSAVQQSVVPVQMPQIQSVAPIQASAPQPAAAAQPKAETPKKAADTSNLIEVKSPIVGTFYRSSSPDKPPFSKVGDTIAEGDVICIIEAMKLFNEIESEVSGKIVKVLVEDATPVQFDQPLFLVDPKG